MSAPILRMNAKAWDEGFEAGESGKLDASPYPSTSIEAWSWSSGYIEGQAKREGFSYSRGRKCPS